ncbi:DNA/RNA non-specific endonuclease [Herbiconiux moechotypicola]|uniref:DNA/RNA non-specific endonuclease n=1 Tax=Herbiconiux moechotypicola TaxID=637393 RepID=A0ABP5QZB3_9MICO|nr:DNA/RNA non-specific endonuclease [Herbiconiux moechotypicola]MCS5731630.1 DNA/RNA non-specific endonuclease [Herbiconiux moechotypicola]
MSTGFDPEFLPVGCPLPRAADPARRLRILHYTHFTVVLDPGRMLAAATAVMIDGRLLRDLPRDDGWHLDPRVLADEQTGPEPYALHDLEPGELVRRRDAAWGTDAVAASAAHDTAAFTNAVPVAAAADPSKHLWNTLEDHLIGHAVAYQLKFAVFTGAVFGTADRLYRGVRLPDRLWKVAAWFDPAREAPASAGFLLDQSAGLGRLDLGDGGRPDPSPRRGDVRVFQVPVADIARDTGLDLGSLVAADRFVAPLRVAGRRWTELHSPGAVRL